MFKQSDCKIIKNKLKLLNITQGEFAKLVGISRSLLSAELNRKYDNYLVENKITAKLKQIEDDKNGNNGTTATDN